MATNHGLPDNAGQSPWHRYVWNYSQDSNRCDSVGCLGMKHRAKEKCAHGNRRRWQIGREWSNASIVFDWPKLESNSSKTPWLGLLWQNTWVLCEGLLHRPRILSKARHRWKWPRRWHWPPSPPRPPLWANWIECWNRSWYISALRFLCGLAKCWNGLRQSPCRFPCVPEKNKCAYY